MEAPLNPAVLESPQERHTDWASVVALITCIGVFGLALGLTYPLLSIMMVDAGFSDFFIGINGSATCVGVLLALFVLPGLLRAWGAFAVVVLGLAGSAACLVAFPYTDPEVTWLVLRIVLGACLNVIFVVSEAWLNSVTAERIRGRVIGAYATVMAGGFALGPLLLVVLGRSGALPFLVCAAIIVAAIAVILPLRHRSAAGLDGMNFGAVRRFLGLAALLAAVVAVFAFFDAAVMTLIPVYLLRSGFTADIGAAALSAMMVGMVLAQYPVGWLLDHFRRATVIGGRSEEHTSELQSLMRISYAIFCLKKIQDIYNQFLQLVKHIKGYKIKATNTFRGPFAPTLLLLTPPTAHL